MYLDKMGEIPMKELRDIENGIRHDFKLFNMIFTAMGVILLGVMGWIGSNVAHIPAIEQQIKDLKETVDLNATEAKGRLGQIEDRVLHLEQHNYNSGSGAGQ